MAEAVNCLDEKFTVIEDEIKDHVHPEVDRIIDVLEGPKIEHLDGTVTRDEPKGIKSKVDEALAGQARIEAQLGNGGIRTKLAARDRIFVALIGGAAVVAAAAIGSIG
ncbi:MAG: hypothetical protein ACYSWU_28635 [Planctomycetota bacterium]